MSTSRDTIGPFGRGRNVESCLGRGMAGRLPRAGVDDADGPAEALSAWELVDELHERSTTLRNRSHLRAREADAAVDGPRGHDNKDQRPWCGPAVMSDPGEHA